jgi:hypothetical protein
MTERIMIAKLDPKFTTNLIYWHILANGKEDEI